MAEYLLFNDRTANLVGNYDSLDEALEGVSFTIDHHHGNPKATRNLTLQQGPKVIASGDELRRRALERFPLRNSA